MFSPSTDSFGGNNKLLHQGMNWPTWPATGKWKHLVLSLISTEKSNQLCLVSFSLFRSVSNRPGVAGLRLEHKGHYRRVMWPSSPRSSDMVSKLLASGNSNQIHPLRWRHQCEQTRDFWFYSTVSWSKYLPGVCLTVWVLCSIKIEEKEIGTGKGGMTDTQLKFLERFYSYQST